MFQNCPCMQIKDILVSVKMGQMKRIYVGSIYKNHKNICLYHVIKLNVRLGVNLIVDLKGLNQNTTVRQGEVETGSVAIGVGTKLYCDHYREQYKTLPL